MFSEKLPIDLSLVNGVSGDPAIFGFFPRTGDGILLDLGHIDSLSNKDLLKVRTVLISHTHIDHFIGFDRLLRVNIPHGREIEIYGPPGIIGNVQGKLRGYLWNLLEPDQLRFTVHELSKSGDILTARLTNSSRGESRFEPEYFVSESVGCLPDETKLETMLLDHATPVVAYVLKFPCRYHVLPEVLNELRLSPGPWIRQLQVAAHNGRKEGDIEIDGKKYSLEKLIKKLLNPIKPSSLAYLTDFSFAWDNIKIIKKTLPECCAIISESNFKDADFSKALDKKHLTTRQAALIAAYSKASELQTFHFSNTYTDTFDTVAGEVQSFFKEFSAEPQMTLKKLIDQEITRI